MSEHPNNDNFLRLYFQIWKNGTCQFQKEFIVQPDGFCHAPMPSLVEISDITKKIKIFGGYIWISNEKVEVVE